MAVAAVLRRCDVKWSLEVRRNGQWEVYWSAELLQTALEDVFLLQQDPAVEAVRMTLDKAEQ